MQELLQQLNVEETAAQEILRHHTQAVDAMRTAVTDMAVESAVRAAGGRNLKAIRALLDMEQIAGAEDVSAAAGDAVERLRREAGFLFAQGRVSAPDTGTVSVARRTPRELAAMSMGEYRKYRKG